MSTMTRPEVVAITGASAGVGRATAQEFARHGAYVGLIARGGAGQDGLEGARKDVEAAGYQVERIGAGQCERRAAEYPNPVGRADCIRIAPDRGGGLGVLFDECH